MILSYGIVLQQPFSRSSARLLSLQYRMALCSAAVPSAAAGASIFLEYGCTCTFKFFSSLTFLFDFCIFCGFFLRGSPSALILFQGLRVPFPLIFYIFVSYSARTVFLVCLIALCLDSARTVFSA